MATHPPYGSDELFFRPSSNPVSPGEEADDEAPRPLRINKHSPQNIAAPSELGYPTGPAGSEGSETKQQWAQYASRPQPRTGRLPLHRLRVRCLRIHIRLRGEALLQATVSGPQVGQQLPPKAQRLKRAEVLGHQAHEERAWQPRMPVLEADTAAVALDSTQVIPIDRPFTDMAVRKASLPR